MRTPARVTALHDGDTAGLVVVDSTAEEVSGWRAERRWLDSTRESALLKSSIFIFDIFIFSATKDQIRNEAVDIGFYVAGRLTALTTHGARGISSLVRHRRPDGLLDTHTRYIDEHANIGKVNTTFYMRAEPPRATRIQIAAAGSRLRRHAAALAGIVQIWGKTNFRGGTESRINNTNH